MEILLLEVCPFNSKRSLLIAGVNRPPSFTSNVDASITKNIEKAYSMNKQEALKAYTGCLFEPLIRKRFNLFETVLINPFKFAVSVAFRKRSVQGSHYNEFKFIG